MMPSSAATEVWPARITVFDISGHYQVLNVTSITIQNHSEHYNMSFINGTGKIGTPEAAFAADNVVSGYAAFVLLGLLSIIGLLSLVAKCGHGWERRQRKKQLREEQRREMAQELKRYGERGHGELDETLLLFALSFDVL